MTREHTIKPDRLASLSDIHLKDLESIKENKTAVVGKVEKCDTDYNLIVDIGNSIKVKIPFEELMFTRDNHIKKVSALHMVGKTVQFIVTHLGESILGSRKQLQTMYLEELKTRQAGDILEAVVINSQPFGVFVDIGYGLTALIPTSCLAISITNETDTMPKEGETLRVILKSIIDNKVTVSYKENLGTWLENITFNEGETLTGEVKHIGDNGMLIELAPNISGLAENREDIHLGDTVSVYVKRIMPDKLKIKLIVLTKSQHKYSRVYKEKLDKNITHIDKWEYSPLDSSRKIATYFKGV